MLFHNQPISLNQVQIHSRSMAHACTVVQVGVEPLLALLPAVQWWCWKTYHEYQIMSIASFSIMDIGNYLKFIWCCGSIPRSANQLLAISVDAIKAVVLLICTGGFGSVCCILLLENTMATWAVSSLVILDDACCGNQDIELWSAAHQEVGNIVTTERFLSYIEMYRNCQ